MREREVGHEEFLAPGRGPSRARVVHEALRQLSDGAGGPVLKEMACEVLSGRIGLKDAMRMRAYADELGERVETAFAEWERIPASERERQVAQARRFLDTDDGRHTR